MLYNISREARAVHVPKMILQPLVENAITHGVGMYLKDGYITIKTEYDSERQTGTIRIIDNGVGLKQEELEQVRREMRQSEHSEQRLGLSNVYTRLQIFFHGRAQMEIKSVPGVGTEITMALPCGNGQ